LPPPGRCSAVALSLKWTGRRGQIGKSAGVWAKFSGARRGRLSAGRRRNRYQRHERFFPHSRPSAATVRHPARRCAPRRAHAPARSVRRRGQSPRLARPPPGVLGMVPRRLPRLRRHRLRAEVSGCRPRGSALCRPLRRLQPVAWMPRSPRAARHARPLAAASGPGLSLRRRGRLEGGAVPHLRAGIFGRTVRVVRALRRPSRPCLTPLAVGLLRHPAEGLGMVAALTRSGGPRHRWG